MKSSFIIYIASLCIISCTTAAKEELQQLSGYWEIEKVVFPDGSTKTYPINQTIDYIQLQTDSSGYRKKLQVRLEGHFITTDHQDHFSVKASAHNLKLHYISAFDQWEETLVSIKKDQLVLKNEDNLTYFYKRFQPIISVK